MGAFSVNLRPCGVCSCRGSEVPELSSSLRILSLTRSSHCCRIWTASSMEQLSRRMLSIDKSLSPSSRVPVLWKRTRKKSYKHKCFWFFKLTLPQPCNISISSCDILKERLFSPLRSYLHSFRCGLSSHSARKHIHYSVYWPRYRVKSSQRHWGKSEAKKTNKKKQLTFIVLAIIVCRSIFRLDTEM